MRKALFGIALLLACAVLAESQGGVYFGDGIRFNVSAQTIADNGTGTAATGTITVLKSYVLLTCSDANGCTVTVGETGARDGQLLTIVNTSANNATFADTAGVTELNGAYTAGQYDSLTLLYRTDRWVEMARSGTTAGSGAPTTSQYVTLATDGTLSNERVLTGTSNQVTVTDAGAGSTVTLSTPQNLHTAATPQFERLGLGAAADANVRLKFAGQYGSTAFDAGNSSTSKTLSWHDGNTQLLTLTGNCTLTLTNPVDGFRYLIVLKQDGTGSRTVTWPSTVKWPAGVAPTLSTTAGKVDIVTLIYVAGIGASGNYIAAASTDFTPS